MFALAVVLSACDGPDSNHTPTDGATDAPADAFVCPVTADEPTSGDSVVTGVASTQSSAVLPGLLICPAGDTDTFQVDLPTSGGNFEIVIETAAAEPSVRGAFLDSTGIPIMNAAPVAGMNAQRIAVTNLPAGVFYVQAFVEPAAVSHYELKITATGP